MRLVAYNLCAWLSDLGSIPSQDKNCKCTDLLLWSKYGTLNINHYCIEGSNNSWYSILIVLVEPIRN